MIVGLDDLNAAGAVARGKADVVELLITYGADLNARDAEGTSALDLALERNNSKSRWIMTHRDGFPRFSARSAWRGDARHRKPCAPSQSYGPSENLGKPPFRSPQANRQRANL